ncbi:CHAT domain-containing protein [Mycena leptocephala]|nr:CHAT domain-containing protein [Mycena leptocephala]
MSVSAAKAAVELIPDNHPDKPSWLSNLGTSLLYRFEHFSDVADINQSVAMFTAAVGLSPESDPQKLWWLSNLGNSLRIRFERFGDLADLNQSVSKLEAVVQLAFDNHPVKPSWLGNLGNCLLCRFERFGDVADINKSVSVFQAAVSLTPDGHPHKAVWLNDLGNSLIRRFERLSALDDLNQSVSVFTAAVTLTPEGHLDKPPRLTNLGNSLAQRFTRLGALADINQSVLMLEAAINLTPVGHPDKPGQLGNLGNSLSLRFDHAGDRTDIDQSVLVSEAAVELTPNDYPDKPSRHNILGSAFRRRLKALNDPVDLERMLQQYTLAASSLTGPTHVRFDAAMMWAKYARIHGDPSVFSAYTTAINILPELAWLGLSISDRHHQILRAGRVVRDAASAAIEAHQYDMAVEWLDQGRSIIWGQLLSLRTPVDDLRQHHPSFADDLVRLSNLLETTGTRSNVAVTTDNVPAKSPQSVAQQSHVYAHERNELLKQIRKLAGFERFLLPKTISELWLAAKMGPVVLLNTSHYEKVIHLPLTDFTLHEAQSLAQSLNSLVEGAARSDRIIMVREGELAPDAEFPRILSVLWTRVVKPILDELALPLCRMQQDLTRIWWCPTGPLAFLPIHAAGLYEHEELGTKLSDFLISSYTPSLAALIQGFRAKNEPEPELQVLAVAQPAALHQGYIPGTLEEVDRIEQIAQGTIPILRLERDLATIEGVRDGMKNSRWAHFACHGVQDISSPTASALLLAGNSRLTLSSIIQLSLPHADLAFLSACQTATGSKNLEDESVHLAAGMLLAGYRGVIGTMWSIRDKDAPQVAADVYENLLKTATPDSTRAAEALHLAVRKLPFHCDSRQTNNYSEQRGRHKRLVMVKNAR